MQKIKNKIKNVQSKNKTTAKIKQHFYANLLFFGLNFVFFVVLFVFLIAIGIVIQTETPQPDVT